MAQTSSEPPADAPQSQTIPVRPEDIVFPITPVPELLVDGLAGVAIVNGIARLACFAVRQTSPNEQKAELTVRLVVSLDALQNMHGAISKLLEDLRENGVIPKAA